MLLLVMELIFTALPYFLTALLLVLLIVALSGNKKKREELRQQLEDIAVQQTGLLEELDWGVIMLNSHMKIIRMNRRAQELTGWNGELASHLPVNRIVQLRPLKNQPGISLDRWIVNENSKERIECEILSRDWREYRVALSRIPWPQKQNPSGYTLILEDQTKKMRQLDRIHHHEKMETVGRLAGGVAHDFNNLLTVITGYADLLDKKLDQEDKLRRYVNHILDTSTKASELINQLLTFSRKGPMVMKKVDVHDVLYKTSELLKHSMDMNIRINQFFPGEPIYVYGDEGLLENIFLNLGINACDAMGEKGTLSFSTSLVELNEQNMESLVLDVDPGDYISISCKDTGHGMEPHVLENLFEPFFTTKSVGKGTGLGLAAVYGTVKSHHGSISVVSEPGEGTEFFIYLPLCKQEASDSIQKA